MEKYVKLNFLGEGSYGFVTKCRNVETGQIVAIKKFLDSDKDKSVKKIALREIKMLKQLTHENLVNLIEVFTYKKRIFLVFEYVDKTVSDELEKFAHGMTEEEVKKILWQVLTAVQFCHNKGVIHRDIKPENILMSKNGIVKLCDFGFARVLSYPGGVMTDYVATRWYRAPELLVGDVHYGRSVDIWALGCLTGELMTGNAVFAGSSDLDQLSLIVGCLGNLSVHLENVFNRNDTFRGTKMPRVTKWQTLEQRYRDKLSNDAICILEQCLQLEAAQRPSCEDLLKMQFFVKDSFNVTFARDLQLLFAKEKNQARKSQEKKSKKLFLKSIEDKSLESAETPKRSVSSDVLFLNSTGTETSAELSLSSNDFEENEIHKLSRKESEGARAFSNPNIASKQNDFAFYGNKMFLSQPRVTKMVPVAKVSNEPKSNLFPSVSVWKVSTNTSPYKVSQASKKVSQHLPHLNNS